MKIWYSPYVLKSYSSLNRLGAREKEGFLIKVQTDEFEAGYADCCPVEIFGDESWQQQIKNLKDRQLNALLKQSLYFAKIDGRAREEKESLFGNKKIKSHYTCNYIEELTQRKLEELTSFGFSTIKIKMGRNVTNEARSFLALVDMAKERFRWRLDFNGQGAKEFLSLMPKDVISQIELIEDPESYNLKSWEKIKSNYGVSIYSDKNQENLWPVVIKPARQNIHARTQDIITNSMDHPVGQSFAYWQAQEDVTSLGKQSRDYGLCTGHLFEPNDFFKELSFYTPYFKPSEGYGVGFESLLKKQQWIAL